MATLFAARDAIVGSGMSRWYQKRVSFSIAQAIQGVSFAWFLSGNSAFLKLPRAFPFLGKGLSVKGDLGSARISQEVVASRPSKADSQ